MYDLKLENDLSKVVLDTCFKIHKLYGSGLFESVYEELVCYELENQKVFFERQKAIPLVHEAIKLEAGFRADVIIEKRC